MKKIIFGLILLIIMAGNGRAQDQGIEVLTWEDCVKEALVNHPGLISSKQKYEQIKASYKITKSALFPQVSGTFSGAASETAGISSENYSYGITASQLLFDGGKTSNDVKESEQNTLAAEYEYAVYSSNVRLSLRNAYIVLLKQQELVRLTQEIVSIRQEDLDLISLRYEAGKEHKGSLLTSEANLSQAKLEYQQAQRNLELAQRQLSKELGRDVFSSLEVKGELEVGKLIGKPNFVELVDETPFLKELAAKTEAASYAVKSSKAEYLPSIYAEGSTGSSGDWVPNNESWSVGFKISLPIWEGGKKKAQVEQSDAMFHQAEAEQKSGEDLLTYTLAETWVELENAIDLVKVKEKYLKANETRSKISDAQYTNGLITYDDWIIIEDALVEVKKQYLNSKADALYAEANWIQAKGGVLENEKEI